MEENILKIGSRTMIFNGGNSLPGCPNSYEEADEWTDEANKDKEYQPLWRFDCGFKLDFDGPLISVESRFYPPKSHYGPKWDGSTRISLLDRKIEEKEFECDSLDELRESVEEYVNGFVEKLQLFFGVRKENKNER